MNGTVNMRVGMRIVIVLVFMPFCTMPMISQSAGKSRIGSRVKKIEESVIKLSDKERSLEARIAALEQVNLIPPPGEFRFHYLQANKDGISIELLNIAANAYQYRIRPRTMGGGSGTYIGYAIPKKMVTSGLATFEVMTFSDSAIFVGKSLLNLGTVKATVNETGSTGHWIFTGEFE